MEDFITINAKAALSVQMDKLAQCKQKRRKLKNLSKLGENPLALEQPIQIVQESSESSKGLLFNILQKSETKEIFSARNFIALKNR
ncbi:hypothetical protein T4A_7266 [Trichinella pseudospiralis]|uniref:Uncharacterized protein n=1 Tax=Trichinella pseudospiralis TaxID=6337 RepID=A0A0V1EVA8_TRIPS|nr:hypothetical protein T4A_7266 [Trichinella pseudospiralis]